MNDVTESNDGLFYGMYPYQTQGANFLFTKKRAMLCDQMGLGKTVQAILALHLINCQTNTGGLRSCLILCPGSALYTWQQELMRWSPPIGERFTLVQGTQAQRDKIWKSEDVLSRK